MPLDPEDAVRALQKRTGAPRGAAVAMLREAVAYNDPDTQEMDLDVTQAFLDREAKRASRAGFTARAARALVQPVKTAVKGMIRADEAVTGGGEDSGQVDAFEGVWDAAALAAAPAVAWLADPFGTAGVTPQDIEQEWGFPAEPGAEDLGSHEEAGVARLAGDVAGSLPFGMAIQQGSRPVAEAIAKRLPGAAKAAGLLDEAAGAGEEIPAGWLAEAAPGVRAVARNTNVLENVIAGGATTAAFGETDPATIGLGAGIGGVVGVAANQLGKWAMQALPEAYAAKPAVKEAVDYLAQQRARARHIAVEEAKQGILTEITNVGEFKAAYDLSVPPQLSGMAPKLNAIDLMTAEEAAQLGNFPPPPNMQSADNFLNTTEAAAAAVRGATPSQASITLDRASRAVRVPEVKPGFEQTIEDLALAKPEDALPGGVTRADAALAPPINPKVSGQAQVAAANAAFDPFGSADPVGDALHEAARKSNLVISGADRVTSRESVAKLAQVFEAQKGRVDDGTLAFVDLGDDAGPDVTYDLDSQTVTISPGFLHSATPAEVEAKVAAALASNVDNADALVTQGGDDLVAFRKNPLGVLEEPTLRATNASGESAASLEAQSRLRQETTSGVRRYVYDVRTNKAVPLVGTDAVDVQPGAHEIVVKAGPAGEVLDFVPGPGVNATGIVRMQSAMPKVVQPATVAEFAANDAVSMLGIEADEAQRLGLVYVGQDGTPNLTYTGQQAILGKPAAQVVAEARVALAEREARIAHFMRRSQRGAIKVQYGKGKRKYTREDFKKENIFGGKDPAAQVTVDATGDPLAPLRDPEIQAGLVVAGSQATKAGLRNARFPHRLFSAYPETTDFYLDILGGRREFVEKLGDKLRIELAELTRHVPKAKEDEVGRLVANLVRNEDNSFTQTLAGADPKLNELAIRAHHIIDQAREIHGVKPQAIAIIRAKVPQWETFTPEQRIQFLQGLRQMQEGGGAQGALPGLDDLAEQTRGMLNWTESSDLYKAIDDRSFSVLPDEAEWAALDEEVRRQAMQGDPSPDMTALLKEKRAALTQLKADIDARHARTYPQMGHVPRRQKYAPLETAGLPSAQLFGWSKNFESNMRRVIDRSMASRVIDIGLNSYRKAAPAIKHDATMLRAMDEFLFQLRGASGYVADRSIAETVTAAASKLRIPVKVTPDMVKNGYGRVAEYLYVTRLAINPTFPLVNSFQPFMSLMPFVKGRNYIAGELLSVTSPKWWKRAQQVPGVVRHTDAYLAEIGRGKGRTVHWIGTPARVAENRNRVSAFITGYKEAAPDGWTPPEYLRTFDCRILKTGTKREIQEEAGRAYSDYANYIQGDVDQLGMFTGGVHKRAWGTWRKFSLNYAAQYYDAVQEARKGNVGPFIKMTAALGLVGGSGVAWYNWANEQAAKKYGVSLPRVGGLSSLADRLMGTNTAHIDLSRRLDPLAGVLPRSGSAEDLLNYGVGPVFGTAINTPRELYYEDRDAQTALNFLSPPIARGVQAYQDWTSPPTTPKGEPITNGRTGSQYFAQGLGLAPSARAARNEAMGKAITALAKGDPDEARRVLNEATAKHGIFWGPQTQAMIKGAAKREAERAAGK